MKEKHEKEKDRWKKSDNAVLISENKRRDKETNEYKSEVKQYKDKLESITGEKKKADEEIRNSKQSMKSQQQYLEENIVEKSKIQAGLQEIKKQRDELEEVSKALEIELHQNKREGNNGDRRGLGNTPDNERKVCRQYAKDRNCKFGEGCRFRHVDICNSLKKGNRCERRNCKYSHEESVMCKYDANGFCRRGQSCRFIHKWVGKNTQDNRMESRTWDMDTRARQRPFFEVSSNGRRMWQNKYEVREGYTGQQNFNEPIKIEREQKEEREKTTEIIIKQIREE